MRLRFIHGAAIATVMVWLALCAAGGVFAIEGALHMPRRGITAADEQRAIALANQVDAELAEAEVVAADGVLLRGWTLRLHGANGDAVILLHGQGDNRAGMLGPASVLLRRGYSVLLPDARGHGESGGEIGTYGVLEADDVERWFEWLKRNQSPHCIDGLGDSMGAAELLRSLDEEPGFCAVVAESPFATFREAAYDRLGQQFSTGQWLGRTLLRPAFLAGVVYARLRYGIDLTRANPADAVARSSVPVLLIHGMEDRNLPVRHSLMIKVASPRVALWEPLGADHCGASTAAPAEYERTVVAWFVQHDHR